MSVYADEVKYYGDKSFVAEIKKEISDRKSNKDTSKYTNKYYISPNGNDNNVW